MRFKRPTIWTRDRNEILWESVERGLSNSEIAKLCGLTTKQVANKLSNEGGRHLIAPEDIDWTDSELSKMNERAIEALRRHHPGEANNAHDAVYSGAVRCTRNARAISGVPVRSSHAAG